VGNQWYWIPEAQNTTPRYAPALVAFVPLDNANQIGWVPLGPGDAYAPHYYDANWQPRYLTRANVSPAQLFNLGVPGAVTVVPVDAWGRAIDPRSIRRVDQQRLASVRSTLDPLTLTPLRNAVIHSAWGRGKIDLPPGIAKKLRDTPVYVGNDIRESRSRKDVAKWMRVERVSDKAKSEKFKIKDERGDARVDSGRKQETDRVGIGAAQGNKDAEQQQRKETRGQDRSQEKGQPKARGERVGNPSKPVSLGPPVREAKPEAKGRKNESAQPAAQGQGHGGGKAAGGQDGGGKGKGKGKGKP
jgi:hypothetical protein